MVMCVCVCYLGYNQGMERQLEEKAHHARLNLGLSHHPLNRSLKWAIKHRAVQVKSGMLTAQ